MIGLQQHIDLVKGWVQKVRQVNGYLTDAGANTSTERVGGNGSDNTLFTGVFLGADVTQLNNTPARRDWQFDLAVESRIPVSFKTAEAQAVAVLEDLFRAIPAKTCAGADNLQTLAITGGGIVREPDGVPYIVVSVTLRGTCFEFTSTPPA